MVEISFQLTEEEAVALENALYRRGNEDREFGETTGDKEIEGLGHWLMLLSDLVSLQSHSQQKFDLKGG